MLMNCWFLLKLMGIGLVVMGVLIMLGCIGSFFVNSDFVWNDQVNVI